MMIVEELDNIFAALGEDEETLEWVAHRKSCNSFAPFLGLGGTKNILDQEMESMGGATLKELVRALAFQQEPRLLVGGCIVSDSTREDRIGMLPDNTSNVLGNPLSSVSLFTSMHRL